MESCILTCNVGYSCLVAKITYAASKKKKKLTETLALKSTETDGCSSLSNGNDLFVLKSSIQNSLNTEQ